MRSSAKEMPPCSAASQKRLATLAAGEYLSHAYIFEGGRGVDKLNAAKIFAKAVHCTAPESGACGICLSCVKTEHDNHEDILYLTREGANIGVKQIEELQIRLRGKPFASERIIAIIDEAERMTPQSQNKLLKTLEEPCGGNIVMLLTANADLLLETIRSRCILLRLEAAPDAATFGAFAALADDFIESLTAGRAYYELSRLVGAASERDAAGDFLDALEFRLRDALVAAPRGTRCADFLHFIGCAEEARRGIAGGLNAKYALKTMILKMQS